MDNSDKITVSGTYKKLKVMGDELIRLYSSHKNELSLAKGIPMAWLKLLYQYSKKVAPLRFRYRGKSKPNYQRPGAFVHKEFADNFAIYERQYGSGIEMDDNEKLVTGILTQAVEDAKYTGIRKQYLKHKIEAINWIMTNDPKFDYYCKLLNIEPSYIKNKIKKHTDTRITKKQRVILIPIVKALLKSKSYNTPPRPQAKEVLHG